MKKLLLLPLIAISFVVTAQTTAIPDANFEQALITLGYDNVIDGGVLTANISGVTSLDVQSQNISDLTGIEDFTALTYLICGSNQLTSLDVSQNTALLGLICGSNQLTSLDVSQNTALEDLWCPNNQLTTLDVSQNTALDYLVCDTNQLTNLDVTGLLGFNCSHNQLTCLNIGQTGSLFGVSAFANPDLTCIEVADSSSYWYVGMNQSIFLIDSQTSFSTNCGNYCSGIDQLLLLLDEQSQDTCDYVDTTFMVVYDTTFTNINDTTFVTIYDTTLTSVTDTLIMDITLTGIPLPNNTNTMLVYPNPASDVVIIDNGDYLSMSGYTLKIINSLGQEVFNSAINIPVFSIPVSTLGSVGTYYIQVFDTSPNIVQTKALILQ
jgi:hypothetical protein